MHDDDGIKSAIRVFGQNLRKARMARGLTLEVVSERAGINIRTLQRFEAGSSNVLITTAMRLKEAIDCSWSELMEGYDKDSSKSSRIETSDREV